MGREDAADEAINRQPIMTDAELLADELRCALAGAAWHGPALQEVTAGISAEEAMQRPIPSAHNIWELVLHLTSWANIAMRRIEGQHPAPREGEDWPEPGEVSDSHWLEMLQALSDSHERLAARVSGMSDGELEQPAPGSPRSIAFMLHGIAQHAAYHGGQIALLRKLLTKYHRRTAL